MHPFDANAGDTVANANVSANGVPGRSVSVRTALGSRVVAWQPAATVAVNDQRFFCHGYGFGTSYLAFGAVGGYTLFGSSVPQVLADEYRKIGEVPTAAGLQANDVLVWWSKEPYHSALVHTPVYTPTGALDPAQTLVNSKTGTGALRVAVALTDVKTEDYPGVFRIEVYRRA
ncbi:hypothetical protein [Frankia canadensis]|nr:hypothetical protein [Frankia canadensis]